MPSATITNKKVVLYYDKGSYSFSDIDLNADDEKMYELAGILNSVQSEKPPVKVVHVVTKRIS